MKSLIGAALSLALLFGANVARAEDEEAAKARAAAEAAERVIHRVSVFNYIQSSRGRTMAYPVLVTMDVKGATALSMFCTKIPLIQETVLKTLLTGPRPSRLSGRRLVSLKSPLRQAVEGIFPPDALRGFEMQVARQPAEFAQALQKTTSACGVITG